ncbi:MAG: DsbA family oxidoreductase [Nitrospirae bacterium]|nr:DsbA family oxidoreductase [Nitrospirota bacterium]
MTIDVYSDVVCPWCYVGKRRLERGLMMAGNDARITWRPFQLNPTMPKDGMDRTTYRQDAVVGSLFRGYFEEGADIGSSSTLVQLAERAGLNVEHFLQGVGGVAEVKAEESTGHRLGIRAVPYFVLNGTYAISGAQPPDRLVLAFKQVDVEQVARKASV